VLDVMRDRKAAEQRVPELVSAKLARGRHHPAHAERSAEFFRVADAARSGADHLLQRDDIGVDRGEHGGDPIGPRAPVESPTPMDVVGDDSEGRRAVTHYAMIVAQ